VTASQQILVHHVAECDANVVLISSNKDNLFGSRNYPYYPVFSLDFSSTGKGVFQAGKEIMWISATFLMSE